MVQSLKNWLLNNKRYLKTTILLIAGLLFIETITYSQTLNLVPNPSFDHLTTCNYFGGSVTPAYPWDTLKTRGGGGVYLLNTCASFYDLEPPHTNVGYQFTRTGSGMIELDLSWDFWHQPGLRTYAQVPLIQTLQNGKSYTVTFYTSRCAGSKHALDRIGAYLDNGTIITTWGNLVAGVTPQIENPIHNIITDTVNWTKIQGCFTANGTESYLTLGNFYPDSLIDTLTLPYNASYGLTGTSSYFFDDVSVIESGSRIYAGNDTTINKGDTIWLGKALEGFPIEWYDMQGNLLANSSELQVHPTTTTNYAVKMDLCGFVSYDTLQVKVGDVGISSLSNSNTQLLISPNPTSNSILITFTKLVSNATIKLTSITGEIVLEKQNQSGNQFTLDISQQPQGIYFIQVQQADKIYRNKIIKQ